MLTADPEGFPLGLAELGLKNQRQGVRTHAPQEAGKPGAAGSGSQTSRPRKTDRRQRAQRKSGLSRPGTSNAAQGEAPRGEIEVAAADRD